MVVLAGELLMSMARRSGQMFGICKVGCIAEDGSVDRKVVGGQVPRPDVQVVFIFGYILLWMQGKHVM